MGSLYLFKKQILIILIKPKDRSTALIPIDILHFKFDLCNLNRNSQLFHLNIFKRLQTINTAYFVMIDQQNN